MITLPVPRNEMLDCESWYKMVDYHYEPLRIDFPSGVVHVDMGSIPDFFRKIQRFPNNKYVVVSSRSDFGLHYQKEYPPWKDYAKFAGQVIGDNNTNGGYEDIVLPAPINREKCCRYDRYSIKCYRYTHATFDEIPANVVRWFVCNNTVLDDNRIFSIPFGINGVDNATKSGDAIHNLMSNMNINGDRLRKLYVNFTFYTNERVRLYELYKNQDYVIAEQQISFEQHLERLAMCNWCLCPAGNGWDSYRILEALYMGCMPIIEYCTALRFYLCLDLPIIGLDSLEMITEPVIDYLYNEWYNDRNQWDLTKVTVSYWKSVIEESRELL